MTAQVISMQRRIDELERAAFEKERTAEMWELFDDAVEIVEVLPRFMLLKVMSRCRQRLTRV